MSKRRADSWQGGRYASGRCWRRGWFCAAALVSLLLGGWLIGPAAGGAAAQGERAIDDPLELAKSRVWDVHGRYAVRGTKVHVPSLRAMLRTGLMRLTGQEDTSAAWRCFIGEEDVVALTFTALGSHSLGTNTAVCAALLESLYEAGFKAEQFMIVGLEELPASAAQTRPCPYGWQAREVDFGSDSDYLASWLDQVTAIINVPTFMDDNVIKFRGALTNLSLPLIKRPGRFYVNQGDPFLAEICALGEIEAKVRLHIANGLRLVYYGGPEVQQRYVYEHGSLLFSLDPVALDRVGLQLTRRVRANAVLPEGAGRNLTVRYLETACALGLGYNDLSFIDYRYGEHGKW